MAWIAEIHKFRVPDMAYVKPEGARSKPRWVKIRKTGKGMWVDLRGNRVYQEDWRYIKHESI